MPQEMKHQEALKIAVETEKGLICFYRRASEMVADDGAKAFFSRLASEKEEQAGKLFRFYKGSEYESFDAFVNSVCNYNADAMKELSSLTDMGIKELRAREIAMEKEQNLEKTLRGKVKNIIDPGVREIFEQMAKASQNHYQIVESEYARMMRMPHETDIDTYVRE